MMKVFDFIRATMELKCNVSGLKGVRHSRQIIVIHRFQSKGMGGSIYRWQMKDFPHLSPCQLFIADRIISSTRDDGVVERVQIDVLAADPWFQI